MAKNVVVRVTCDRCEGAVDAEQSVHFAYDGTQYEIDLCGRHLQEYHDAFRPYTGAGRVAGPTRSRTRARRGGEDLGAIREWARSQGMDVSDRGRLPASVVEAYRSAHGR